MAWLDSAACSCRGLPHWTTPYPTATILVMTRSHVRRAVLAAASAALAAGASTLPISACGEPYAETPQQVEEAGTDAGKNADAAAPRPPDPCAHAFPAAPPDTDDAPGEELPPFFVAVRTIQLAGENGAVPGFDLDGVCTCDTRPDTAYDGGPSCVASAPRCDADGGVDNSLSVLASQLSPFFALDDVPRKLIAAGRRTLLVQIGKYNGRANDKEIAVGFALSDGIREKGCATSIENPAKGIWSPGWCGDDRWSLLPDSIIPSTKQPLIQGVGYVREGVLILQIGGTLLLPFNEVSVLTFGSPVITGTLVPLREDLQPRDRATQPTDKEKRLWSITKGTVAGRVKATELLGALGTIELPRLGDGGSAGYLCQETQYAFARDQICASLDMSSSKALDFDPRAQCDSLSTALTFTAFPAFPGDVRATAPTENPCVAGANGQPPDAGGRPYRCSQ